MNKKVAGIIVAGGVGVRMKEKLPKQFLPLAGKPIIAYSLEAFERNELISDIVVVSHKDYISEVEEIAASFKISKLFKVVPGGQTRQESSYSGLKNCPQGTEYVLVHDAVRPFLTGGMIEVTLNAAKETGAAGCSIKITDTVVTQQDDYINEVLSRDDLKCMQTPQAFKCDNLLKAHQDALDKGLTDSTDDCNLVLSSGGKVKLADGSKLNIKITDKLDLEYAEYLLAAGVLDKR